MKKIKLFGGCVVLWAGIWVFLGLFLPSTGGLPLKTRYEFWRAQVQEVRKEGWHGYLVDRCSGTNPSISECACVALVHDLGDQGSTWDQVLLAPPAEWTHRNVSSPLRILAVDLPGFGQSLRASDSTRYRVRHQAQDLQKFLSSYCASWIVVGNGWGGWIATWLALESPQMIHRLLLLNTQGMQADTHRTEDLLSAATVERMKEFVRKAYYRSQDISESMYIDLVQQMQTKPIRQIVQAQTPEDRLDTFLPALRPLTLFAWGKEDQLNPLDLGRQMKVSVPSAGWREFPECGHFPQKECPIVVIQSIADVIRSGAY